MLKQLASTAGIDLRPRHGQPKISRVVLATLAAIAGSLAADALLAVIGQAIFPGARPVVTRIAADPLAAATRTRRDVAQFNKLD